MKTIGQKVKELRDVFGLSQAQLAIKLGNSRSLISLWESGERKPDYNDIAELARIFEVSTDYLIGTTTVPDGEIVNINTLKAMKAKVSVYGSIPAGNALEAIENIIGEVEVPTKIAKRKDLFGLKVSGESMSKIVPDGAIAIFEKTCELNNGDIGAILVNGYDATMKHFYKLNNSIVLEPDSYNPDYKAMIIDGDDVSDVKVIGKLVWFCMGFD